MRRGLLMILLSFVAPNAQAARSGPGFLFDFNAYIYNSTQENSPGGTSDDNTYIYDMKLGYVTAGSLYLGGIYSTRNRNGSAVSSESGSAEGLSIGYLGEAGFYLMGHYYLSARLGDWKDGSGYQGDFGYLTEDSGPFHVGIELSYRNIEYRSNASSANSSHRVKELFPMLTAAFFF